MKRLRAIAPLLALVACSQASSGHLVVRPASVTYSLSSTAVQPIVISEPGYTGRFRVAVGTVGSVAALRFPDGPQENDLVANGPGPVTVDVVVFDTGNDAVTVSDDNGNTIRVPVHEPVDVSMLECLDGMSMEPWLALLGLSILACIAAFFFLRRVQRRLVRRLVVAALVLAVLFFAAWSAGHYLAYVWCGGLEHGGLGGWP